MKERHCRSCWQPVPRLSRRCAHCGHLDLTRYGAGLVELVIYVAVGTTAVGLASWAVSLIVRGFVHTPMY